MVRLTAILLALLTTVSMLPVASAQGEPFLLEDDAGDVEATGGLGAQMRSTDLRALSVSETEDRFTFQVTVDALDASAYRNDRSYYDIDFRHNDAAYRINIGVSDVSGGWSNLYRYDAATDDYSWVRYYRPVLDLQEGTITTEFEREDMADRSGALPMRGRAFEDLSVSARHWTSGSAFPGFDRMPDNGGATLPITIGLEQSGVASMSSPTPFRASNGEATTYRFQAHLSNAGDDADRYEIMVADVPPGWEVKAPDVVPVAAGQTVRFDVLLRTPFAHQHGARDSFQIHAHGTNDTDSVARLELGVAYSEIPQPSGHHPELYIHSIVNSETFAPVTDVTNPNAWHKQVIMNTLEDYGGDAGVPVKGRWGGQVAPFGSALSVGIGVDAEPRYYWPISLSPGLEMGLDMDLDAVGTVETTLRAPVTMLDAEVDGGLYHCSRTGGDFACTTLATLRAEPFDMQAGETVDVSASIVPHPEGDRIAYHPDAYLYLYVGLPGVKPTVGLGAEAPEMLPGGKIVLPLEEYSDAVEAAWDEVEAPVTTVEGIQPVSDEVVDTPGLGVGALVLALFALARRRR